MRRWKNYYLWLVSISCIMILAGCGKKENTDLEEKETRPSVVQTEEKKEDLMEEITTETDDSTIDKKDPESGDPSESMEQKDDSLNNEVTEEDQSGIVDEITDIPDDIDVKTDSEN